MHQTFSKISNTRKAFHSKQPNTAYPNKQTKKKNSENRHVPLSNPNILIQNLRARARAHGFVYKHSDTLTEIRLTKRQLKNVIIIHIIKCIKKAQKSSYKKRARVKNESARSAGNNPISVRKLSKFARLYQNEKKLF